MKVSWRLFFEDNKNRQFFYISLLVLSLILFLFLHFLTYNEGRNGYVFSDPLLNMFRPLDVSFFTFILTYGLCIAGLIASLRSPFLFLKIIQVYGLITLLRMASLYILPLEPPAQIIPLQDPFLKFSFYSGRDNLKDLFFSGHTAALFLFAFCFRNRKLKIAFISGAVLVAGLLVLQHVHFSIDVIAAPFFTGMAFLLHNKLIIQK
jgi:hypothetical protein